MKEERYKENGAVQVGRCIFFYRDAKGRLRQLPKNALDEDILSADVATLKLHHHKMDGKECVLSGTQQR